MTLEIMGRPGCGKSVVSGQVRDACSVTVISGPGASRWNGYCERLWYVCAMPVTSILLYASVLLRKDSGKDNVKRVLSVQRVCWRLRGGGGRSVLVDDGPFHMLGMALLGTRATRMSKTVLGLCVFWLRRTVSLFVVIEEDTNACIENIARRHAPRSRFSSASTADMMEMLRMDEAYDELIATMEMTSGMTVYRRSGLRSSREKICSLFDKRAAH